MLPYGVMDHYLSVERMDLGLLPSADIYALQLIAHPVGNDSQPLSGPQSPRTVLGGFVAWGGHMPSLHISGDLHFTRQQGVKYPCSQIIATGEHIVHIMTAWL